MLAERFMASDISYKDERFWVSNQRLSTLIDFALEVGGRTGLASAEKASVERLRKEDESGQLFPGCSFDLDERFPTVEEKIFWARVFSEVAQDIFLRRLGNHEIDTWQASAICDAKLIARMLEDAVRNAEVK
jgi:hypothetical protein